MNKFYKKIRNSLRTPRPTVWAVNPLDTSYPQLYNMQWDTPWGEFMATNKYWKICLKTLENNDIAVMCYACKNIVKKGEKYFFAISFTAHYNCCNDVTLKMEKAELKCAIHPLQLGTILIDTNNGRWDCRCRACWMDVRKANPTMKFEACNDLEMIREAQKGVHIM